MGQLYPIRDQAFGTTGLILAGAKLYLYDSVATTTPKTAYTDSALSVPHDVPIQADSSGVFPQIYAATGEAYHAILKTSAGTTVQTIENWTALGADDAATFTRDFTTNGRVQIVGSGGMPNLEFGDPTGDDIGGDGRIGGWDGTQATTLEIDSAATTMTGNVQIDGNLLVSGTFPGAVVLSSGTVSAAASTNIALSSSYNAYQLDMSYVVPSAAITLEALFAFDGVPTFKVGVDDYGWFIQSWGITTGTNAGAVDNSDARLAIMNTGAATAGAPGHCRMIIMSRTGKESGFHANFSAPAAAYDHYVGQSAGQTRGKNYGKATHIQIKTSSGTVSFYYTLTGLPSL